MTHRNCPAQHFFYTTANTLSCLCFTVPNRLDNAENILDINVFDQRSAQFGNRISIEGVSPLLPMLMVFLLALFALDKLLGREFESDTLLCASSAPRCYRVLTLRDKLPRFVASIPRFT